MADLNQFDDPVGSLQLFVDQNFSDMKATIRSKTDGTLMVLCSATLHPRAPGSGVSSNFGGGAGSSDMADTPPFKRTRRFGLLALKMGSHRRRPRRRRLRRHRRFPRRAAPRPSSSAAAPHSGRRNR